MLNIPGRNIHREPTHEVGSSRIRLASGVLPVQLCLRQTLWASRNSSAPKHTWNSSALLALENLLLTGPAPSPLTQIAWSHSSLTHLPRLRRRILFPDRKNMFVSLQSECIEIQKAG